MKRLVFVLVLLYGHLVIGMAVNPNTQKELQVINAIAHGDAVGVKHALDAGLDVNKPFTTMGYRGYTPVMIALMDKIPLYTVRNNTVQLLKLIDNTPKRYAIAESLILQGADKAHLDLLFADATIQKNAQKALWLAKHAKPKVDQRMLATIKELANTSKPADKILWTEVVTRLEKPRTQLPVVTSEEQKELDLYYALQKRDLAAVKRAIAAGASPHEFRHIAGMGSLSASERRPFMWVPMDSRGYEILDYLLSIGVDKKVLNDLLVLEVNEANQPGLEWVLTRIKSVEPAVIEQAKQLEKEETDLAKKARYTQIRKLLEAKK